MTGSCKPPTPVCMRGAPEWVQYQPRDGVTSWAVSRPQAKPTKTLDAPNRPLLLSQEGMGTQKQANNMGQAT